jgi:hypothetical protein
MDNTTNARNAPMLWITYAPENGYSVVERHDALGSPADHWERYTLAESIALIEEAIVVARALRPGRGMPVVIDPDVMLVFRG